MHLPKSTAIPADTSAGPGATAVARTPASARMRVDKSVRKHMMLV